MWVSTEALLAYYMIHHYLPWKANRGSYQVKALATLLLPLIIITEPTTHRVLLVGKGLPRNRMDIPQGNEVILSWNPPSTGPSEEELPPAHTDPIPFGAPPA